MSLLNGLKDAMSNPLFDAVTESDMDESFDFEMALEAAIDKQIELSDDDIAAILDDENPDNIVADISSKDENISNIAKDSVDEDLNALESMLNEILAEESEEPSGDFESNNLCGSKAKACEMDDEDEFEEELEDDTDEDDDDYTSLDSLLNSVFKN